MSLLEMIIKEYLTIVENLALSETIENNRIMLTRDIFKNLLEKYSYLTFKQKVEVYKDLNLIVHEKNNFTIPYKDKELKKTVRKVAINYKTYLTIKQYYEKNL